MLMRTAGVLFPGAAQHVAHKGVYARLRGLCEVVRCRPGIVPGSESEPYRFGVGMMRNDPGSAVHRSARAARCTASGKSIVASTRIKQEVALRGWRGKEADRIEGKAGRGDHRAMGFARALPILVL